MINYLTRTIRNNLQTFRAIKNIHESADIFKAVTFNDTKQIRFLVKTGASTNQSREDTVTPLVLATSLGHVESVQTLLELGADPNIATSEGWIAYDFAHNKGDLVISTMLRNHGSPSTSNAEPDRISQDLDVFLDNSDLILPKQSFEKYSQLVKDSLGTEEAAKVEKQLKNTKYRALLKQLYSVEALSAAHFANNNFITMHAPMSLGSYDVSMAKRRKIDLVDFYQQKFDITEQLLHKLLPDSVFTEKPTHICEIGGAWGATIKHFMNRFSIKEYQNYEPDTAYAQWTHERFGAKKMPVDGETLSGTDNDSMDLVISNNVFLFVPVIKIWSYLTEMRRVIKKNGIIIFNAVVSDQRTEEDLHMYLDCCFPKRSICLLPRDIIDRTFPQPEFEVLSIVDREYFIIKRII